MPSNVELRFSRQEYADRLTKVRSAMESKGIGLLVAADPSNMAWLTGYDGWSFYTHQAVIVSHDDEPMWWGRQMDAAGAMRTVYMDERHIVSYEDHYVQSTVRHPHQQLAELLADSGAASDRIGVEMDNYYYSAAAHRHLVAGLPEAEFIDATGLVNWERVIKSSQEIAYMRRAARIVERMHDTARELIEPGVRKNDLVAEILRTAIGGTEEFGGDYSAFVPLLPTGEDASAPHLTWDDKPFESGAGTFFELGGAYHRYQLPLCRSVYLGTPPQYLLDAEKALLEGLEAGLEAARAGNRAGDIAQALHSTLAKAGIERDARCGYSIGLSYPPDWGERTISIRSFDETVLQPGMTLHFMPGLWMDGWGLEITESILIVDGPAETFANYPRELFVKS